MVETKRDIIRTTVNEDNQCSNYYGVNEVNKEMELGLQVEPLEEKRKINCKQNFKQRVHTKDTFKKLPKDFAFNSSEFSDDSSDDDQLVNNDEVSLNDLSFYEKSRKHYNQECKEECIQTHLLTNGLELSEDYISRYQRSLPKEFYDKMKDPRFCISLCKTNPSKYKLCEVEIFNSHRALCRSIDDNMEIEISGRSKCGKVFNQDEVVVEIFPKRTKNEGSQIKDNKFYGKIISITKTNKNRPRNPVFVCTLDNYHMYFMKPLCKTVPKIYVLNEEHKASSKGKIMLYRYDSQTKELIIDKSISIDQSKRKEYIFLVCYITWNGLFPRGAVIRFFDGNCDIQTSLRLVCLRNNVSVLYRKSTVDYTEEILSRERIDDKERRDYSECLCAFSLDSDETKDIDDALSVSKISAKEYEIGVHIADVSSIIKKNDPIDLEAQDRSTSYYPGKYSPYHMFPEPLATKIFSLLRDQKRKALSIFYKVDESGKIFLQRIERTIIKSQECLTYEKAWIILSSDDEELKFRKELEILRKISKILRLERLGNRIFSLPFESPYHNDSASYFQFLEVHHMVEEFMILANKTIAEKLVGYFPTCVPLLIQSEPPASSIDKWLECHPDIGHFVLSLQHQRLKPDVVLSFDNHTSLPIPIQQYIWTKIAISLKERNYEKATRYIGTDEFHPKQATAYESWISFQETSSYQCSGVSKNNLHFSLGISPYVHFTSPIRRYADLIIHRLVHAMVDNHESPYTSEEVGQICKKINGNRSRGFKKQCRLLHLASQFLSRPILLHGLVTSASDKSMFICFPGIKGLTRSCGEIQFHLLKLKSKPKLDKDSTVLVTLNWQQRLYSSLEFACTDRETSNNSGQIEINPHQKVVFVPFPNWRNLITCLVKQNFSSIDTDIFEENSLITVNECKGTHNDATSESSDGEIKKLQTEFSSTIRKSQVISVQLGCEKSGGLVAPSVHLVELTRNIKFCIQHMSKPVKCFASYAHLHDCNRINRTVSPKEYIKRWKKIFRMESSTKAVKSTSIIINDLHVSFQRDEGYDGSFVLSKLFCQERDIFIDFTWNEEDKMETSHQTDFLCIRCELVGDVPSKAKADCPPDERWIWVGHGKTKCLQRGNENKNIKVHFKLHKENCKPEHSMRHAKTSTGLDYTVEILQMNVDDKQIEKALLRLDKVPLAKSIALNRKIPKLDEHDKSSKQIMFIEQSLPRNNGKQLIAIRKALSSRFTLIQGPPGTGKTLTGIKLILLFTKVNLQFRKDRGEHHQVVYCGPSNKSVDLVARWIKGEIPHLSLNIVRMYGSSVENTIFPLPNRDYINQSSCKDNRPDSELAEISLHNLIREKDRPYAEEITMFDKKFNANPDEATLDDILNYKKVVSKAGQEELQKYDVIFCTTAVATNSKFLKATKGKIFQLIIDEAGMCTEPETIAPIIATEAKQVVLIGDHKQLQPIVNCHEAAKLGLSKSLFERYANNAVMLDIQYRMNPKICEFPSQQFYEGKLRTGPEGRWIVDEPLKIWRNPRIPLLFCHIEGEEEILEVATEEGNQQSRRNRAEVDHVVKVYEYLMSHNKMKESHVKVMSQYNAQCFAIREALERKRFDNPNVTTVVSSQGGEWDYVIFSAVRSLPEYRIEKCNKGWCQKNLGFITDVHQINVVLTRASKGIIIIGNKNLLQCDDTWKALLYHYARLGCVEDAETQDLTPLPRSKRRRSNRR
nr:helicase with zinc finger domain 2-like isoform X2 [Crassostrea virginica]